MTSLTDRKLTNQLSKYVFEARNFVSIIARSVFFYWLLVNKYMFFHFFLNHDIISFQVLYQTRLSMPLGFFFIYI